MPFPAPPTSEPPRRPSSKRCCNPPPLSPLTTEPRAVGWLAGDSGGVKGGVSDRRERDEPGEREASLANTLLLLPLPAFSELGETAAGPFASRRSASNCLRCFSWRSRSSMRPTVRSLTRMRNLSASDAAGWVPARTSVPIPTPTRFRTKPRLSFSILKRLITCHV